MKFQFGRQSGLYGRRLDKEIKRLSFIPCNEDGKIEYVLCYEGRIPRPKDEPSLYRSANVKMTSPEEFTLTYRGIDEIVMLLTIEEDDRFRKDNPQIVEKYELFQVD